MLTGDDDTVPALPWRVIVAETRTGRVVEPSLPYLGSPSYEYGINMTGGWGVKLPIDDSVLPKDYIEELSDPWRFCVGVVSGSHIAQLGPLVAESYSDGGKLASTDIAGGGIWDLLTRKRLLVTGDVDGATIKTPDADVVFGPGPTSPKGTTIPLANRNLSLHTIAKRLVQISMDRTDGELPIVLPADIAGTSEREYPGYDLAYVGERLLQLTQVENGPEVEFRPQFTDDTHAYVQWVMRIGTPAAGGRLGNLDAPHQWEYGNALTRLNFTRDGSQQTHARFERGGGSERDLKVGYAADDTTPSYASLGWPLIEDAGTQHSSATEQDTLDEWATAAIGTNKRPLTSWTAVVRVNGDNGAGQETGSPPLYEFAAGDCAVFQIEGHRRIKDGRYKVRILSVSGQGPDTASVTTQLVEELT
jgi:hypothetical protein